jgi:hypothetical protein
MHFNLPNFRRFVVRVAGLTALPCVDFHICETVRKCFIICQVMPTRFRIIDQECFAILRKCFFFHFWLRYLSSGITRKPIPGCDRSYGVGRSFYFRLGLFTGFRPLDARRSLDHCLLHNPGPGRWLSNDHRKVLPCLK